MRGLKMNINKDIKITLNEEEKQAVANVGVIVAKFTNKNLCDKMSCCSCPLGAFCPCTSCTDSFEEILNDIANME